jgi:hypothetical protein
MSQVRHGESVLWRIRDQIGERSPRRPGDPEYFRGRELLVRVGPSQGCLPKIVSAGRRNPRARSTRFAQDRLTEGLQFRRLRVLP